MGFRDMQEKLENIYWFVLLFPRKKIGLFYAFDNYYWLGSL